MALSEEASVPVPEHCEIHKYCSMFPDMSATKASDAAEMNPQFAALMEDIRANGQLVAIVMYKGAILDGRNRWKALKKIGAAEMKIQQFEGDDTEALAYSTSMNLKRRSLTSGQRAMIGVAIEKELSELAAARKASGKGSEGSGGRGKKADRADGKKAGRDSGRASAAAAAQVDVSRNSVQLAKKISKDHPDIADKLSRGEISISQAQKMVHKVESESKPVTDAFDTVVPKDMVLCFTDASFPDEEDVVTRGDLNMALNAIKRAGNWITSTAAAMVAASTPNKKNALAGIDMPLVEKLLRELSATIRSGRPYCLTPEDAQDKTAKRRGWMTEGEYKLHTKAGKPVKEEGAEKEEKAAKAATGKAKTARK
jgi:hypothetical protein